jgi:hypothetical protein
MRLVPKVAGSAAAVVLLLSASACTKATNSGSSATTTSTANTPTTAATTTTTTAPARHVTGTAATLGAGNFTGGKDVAVGLYDVTGAAGESGNFIVQGKDTYDEILGGSDGVSKVRVQISNGDQIQISGISAVTFTPVTTPLVTTHTPVTLYAGTWTVGQDIGSGRYVATPGAGESGNFIVEAEGVDEILGGSDGVPNVTVNLSKGDVITVGSLNQVTMSPS